MLLAAWQLALLGHVRDYGDATPLFSAFVDTAVGSKQSSGSYRAIRALFPAAQRLLFCTDVAGEASAALEAGWSAALLERPGNAPLPQPPPAPVFPDLHAVRAWPFFQEAKNA